MSWLSDGKFWVYGAAVGATAIAGGLVSRGVISKKSPKESNVAANWNKEYESKLTPPSWVFMVVWTVLFVLIFVAGYNADRVLTDKINREINPKTKSELESKRNKLRWLFAAQLALNFAWVVFAFGLDEVSLALLVHTALIFIVSWLLVEYYNTDKVAFGLFTPYLVWLIFAYYLTSTIIYNIGSQNKKRPHFD